MALATAISQWGQAFFQQWAAVAGETVRFIPGLMAAALALVIAWIVAKVLERLTILILDGVKFDELLARGPVNSAALESAQARTPVSGIIAMLVFWAIFFFMGLAPAADLLGLKPARVLIERIIDFLPVVLAALLAVAAGAFIARLLQESIKSVLATANLPYGRELGWLGYGMVALFGLSLALRVLRITTPALTTALMIVGAAAGLAVAIAFGVGARDVLGALAAGRGLKGRLFEGDEVSVENYTGTVERLGPDAVDLRTSAGLVTIPNHLFMQKVVVKKASPPRRAA